MYTSNVKLCRSLLMRGAGTFSLLFYLSGCGGGSSSSGATPKATPTPISTPLPTATPIPTVLRLACVGDSITAGAGVADPATNAYPAVLGRSLGAGYRVTNYGLSGATLRLNTGLPYQTALVYALALAAKPDVVVVALGTNDAGQSFDALVRVAFVRDYLKLIADFRRVRPGVRLYLCVPPAAYGTFLGRAETIRSDVAPLVRQIAADTGATVIDLFSVTQDQPQLFPDSLHPNEAGARKIAAEVQRVLLVP